MILPSIRIVKIRHKFQTRLIVVMGTTMEEFYRVLQEGANFLTSFYSQRNIGLLLENPIPREIGTAILSYTVLRKLAGFHPKIVADELVVQELSDLVREVLKRDSFRVTRQPFFQPLALTFIIEAVREFEDYQEQARFLEEAVHLILKYQNDDGSWSYFLRDPFEGRTIPTALAVQQLRFVQKRFSKLSIEERYLHESLNKAVRWLKDSQNLYGAWGFTRGDISRSISTAISVMALHDETWKGAEIAKRWLVEGQKPDGSWDSSEEIVSFARLPPFHLKWFSTPYVVAAFSKLRMPINEPPIHRAIKYLLRSSDPRTGGWGFTRSSVADPWHTAETLHALIRLEPFIKDFTYSYPLWATARKTGAILTPILASLALLSTLSFPTLTTTISVLLGTSLLAWTIPSIWCRSKSFNHFKQSKKHVSLRIE